MNFSTSNRKTKQQIKAELLLSFLINFKGNLYVTKKPRRRLR